MAINTLNSQVSNVLKDIGYSKIREEDPITPRDCFKRLLIRGDSIDYQIIDDRTFVISIPDTVYHRAIYSDLKYYLERVKRQRLAVQRLFEGDSVPSAWILVSSYYLGFFAAIEILRLCGKHHIYLSNNESTEISGYSSTSAKLAEGGVYSCPSVSVNQTTGDISIRFAKDSSKPHDVTWDSISKVVGDKSYISAIVDEQERKQTLLFKQIVDKQYKSWERPNTVRNEWNYSNVEAYTRKYDNYARDFSTILRDESYSGAKEWANRRRIQHDIATNCAGLAFIVKTLETSLMNISSKIL